MDKLDIFILQYGDTIAGILVFFAVLIGLYVFSMTSSSLPEDERWDYKS